MQCPYENPGIMRDGRLRPADIREATGQIEALQLLEQRDRILMARNEEYRRQIEDGWPAARRSGFVDGDEVFDRIDSELAAIESAGSSGG
jgi:hypothetical protein